MIKLFHGSRHDLTAEGFSLDRTSSDFGNAGARGVGVYLSEDRSVAGKYRSAGFGAILLDGKPLDEDSVFALLDPPHVCTQVAELMRSYWQQPDAMRKLRTAVTQVAKSECSRYPSSTAAWTQARALVKKAKSITVDPGHLYTVAVDVKESDLLDWELPLSKQSPFVRSALARSGILPEAIVYAGRNEPTGFDVMTALKRRDPDTYWGPNYGRKASEALLAVGIPGNRHDDYELRKAGIIKSNYVIWDTARLKVLAKDGVLLEPDTRPRHATPPLYHGTPAGPVTELKTGRAGLIFTSASQDYSALYGKHVLRVEVDLRNPADLENDPVARQLAIDNFNACNFRDTDNGANPRFDPKEDEVWELAESPTFKEAMEKAGYDGAIFTETSSDGGISGRTYAAFHASQVRVLPSLKKSPSRVDPEGGLAIRPLEPPAVPRALAKTAHSLEP